MPLPEGIDAVVPKRLELHLVLDNYATHKTEPVKKWLLRHPRFHLHFTPTSASWLNLVECWFAELTCRRLRRSAHRSVVELERDIRGWINEWNKNPKPFIWTKTRACASSRVRPTGVRMPRVGVDDRADTESVIIQVSKPSDQEGSRVRCLIFPDPCRVGQVGSAQPGRRG